MWLNARTVSISVKLDQELAGRVGVLRLEDGGECLDVVKEGDVVPVVGELLERGGVREREALQVAARNARARE